MNIEEEVRRLIAEMPELAQLNAFANMEVPVFWKGVEQKDIIKARFNNWICSFMEHGDKVYLDCLPPESDNMVIISADSVEELNKIVDDEDRYPLLRLTGKRVERNEFNDVLFLRKDLLRRKREYEKQSN